jgi:hypothetical protein
VDATLPIADGAADQLSSSAKSVSAVPATRRHAALVHVTYRITTLAFFALLVSEGEIVLSHPRSCCGSCEPADGAQSALPAGAVPLDSRADGVCCGISKPDSGP